MDLKSLTRWCFTSLQHDMYRAFHCLLMQNHATVHKPCCIFLFIFYPFLGFTADELSIAKKSTPPSVYTLNIPLKLIFQHMWTAGVLLWSSVTLDGTCWNIKMERKFNYPLLCCCILIMLQSGSSNWVVVVMDLNRFLGYWVSVLEWWVRVFAHLLRKVMVLHTFV